MGEQHQQVIDDVRRFIDDVPASLVARLAGRFHQFVGLFGDFRADFRVAPRIEPGGVGIRRRIEFAVFEDRHQLVQDVGHWRPSLQGWWRNTHWDPPANAAFWRRFAIDHRKFGPPMAAMAELSTENTVCPRPPALDCWYLTGPTAAGKSKVGVEAAERLNAEIIS